MNDIKLEIETKLNSTEMNVQDIRNFIFYTVFGKTHVRLDKQDTFLADAVIDKLGYMSSEDLMRTVVELNIHSFQLEDFEDAIHGKYPSSVWKPFARVGSNTLTDS